MRAPSVIRPHTFAHSSTPPQHMPRHLSPHTLPHPRASNAHTSTSLDSNVVCPGHAWAHGRARQACTPLLLVAFKYAPRCLEGYRAVGSIPRLRPLIQQLPGASREHAPSCIPARSSFRSRRTGGGSRGWGEVDRWVERKSEVGRGIDVAWGSSPDRRRRAWGQQPSAAGGGGRGWAAWSTGICYGVSGSRCREPRFAPAG